MTTTRPEFLDKPIQIRRKKPWWWGSIGKKIEPTAERPMWIWWSHVPAYGHAAHSHPAMCCAMRPSFNPQFYPIAGISQPSFDTQYLTGAYATLNATTDTLDISESQLDAKIDAHAMFMAEQVANMLFADNLFRGKGSHHDGEYGGAFHFHQLGVASWTAADATYTFAPLMQHPADAAPRSVTVKTGPATTRTITLPKRLINTLPPIDGTSAADLAAIEAMTDTVRHSGYFTMRTAFGRDINYRVAKRFALYLKAMCDNYYSPFGGQFELCYPKFCPLSLEQLGYVFVGPSARLIPQDSPSIPTAYYEQVGSFWNERGDADALSTRVTAETIFQTAAGQSMTLARAMQADPVLSGSVFLSAYAPLVGVAGGIADVAQNYAFRRLEAHAQNWAIADSIRRALREVFPLIEVTNFDAVEVKDIGTPYTRVGGGIQSTATQNLLDYQGPTLYGRNTGAGANSIASGTAGAVEQWDWDNLEEAVGVMSTLRTDSSPFLPFIHGITSQTRLAAGLDGEWGGTPEFLGRLVRATSGTYGPKAYSIYSGDLDITYAAVCEISEELAADS